MFDIVHLLTGDSSYPPSLDSMVSLYVEKRRFDVERVAWYSHYVDRDQAVQFVEAYEALPEPARLHLLLSPSHYESVDDFNHHNSLENLVDLLMLSRDEMSLVKAEPPEGHRGNADAIWSPMGDEVMRRTGEGWVRGKTTRLDSLILIDFDSPYARMTRPTSPLMYRPAEDFTDDERTIVVMKLERALRYIDDVAPTFGRLVRNYTRVIRIRKCEEENVFSSEHVTATIGEVRLLNAHRAEHRMTRLAEALLHESVHNMLSTYEYLNGMFVLAGDEKRYRPVSPWTGNPIPVPSFCHAAFVWFSLFHFAQRELRQPELDEMRLAEILQRRNQYASGFMLPVPIFDCVRDLATFAYFLPQVMNSLQSIVCSALDPSQPPERADSTAPQMAAV